MSLTIMAAEKPGLKSRLAAEVSTMPGTGRWLSMAQHEAEALEAMSKKVRASRPSFSPRVKASATAIMEMPRIMLLQTLAAWPLPGAPAWTMVRPMAAKTGLARAKAAAEPPAMKVSVAASAPATPPETGASSISWPAAAAAPWTARALATSMVEQSIRSAPGPAAAITPPAPM